MEQETWNMATATLQRFDFLLKQSSFMAQTHNLIGWHTVLMDIRRNLAAFCPDTEWGQAEAMFNTLPRGWRMRTGKVHPKHYAEVNRIFDEIYILFIKVMKSKGLLMPKSVDSSKAVIDF